MWRHFIIVRWQHGTPIVLCPKTSQVGDQRVTAIVAELSKWRELLLRLPSIQTQTGPYFSPCLVAGPGCVRM